MSRLQPNTLLGSTAPHLTPRLQPNTIPFSAPHHLISEHFSAPQQHTSAHSSATLHFISTLGSTAHHLNPLHFTPEQLSASLYPNSFLGYSAFHFIALYSLVGPKKKRVKSIILYTSDKAHVQPVLALPGSTEISRA